MMMMIVMMTMTIETCLRVLECVGGMHCLPCLLTYLRSHGHGSRHQQPRVGHSRRHQAEFRRLDKINKVLHLLLEAWLILVLGLVPMCHHRLVRICKWKCLEKGESMEGGKCLDRGP